MGEVAELFFLALEEADDDDVEDFSETLGGAPPFWPSPTPGLAGDFFVPVFSPVRFPSSDGGSDSDSDPVSLVLDLFERHPPSPPPESRDAFADALDSYGFRVLDGIEDMGSDYLGLGLGLGLESGFETQDDGAPDEATHGEGEGQGLGLRIVGFESDSDSEDEQIGTAGNGSDSGGVPDLCWDCLRIDEDQREQVEDFEWDEVDGGLNDREVLSMMVGMDDDGRGELDHDDPDPDEEQQVRGRGNVEWEVLNTFNVREGEEEDADSYLGDNVEDFINTLEYEVLFGQFADQESSLRGSPPAAKSVVDSLPAIILTEEDVAKNNTLCAVCKDDISLDDKPKQLPCLHHYHRDCILPWLCIRNTCPVCRYELPTDDPEYDISRAQRQRAAGVGHIEESLSQQELSSNYHIEESLSQRSQSDSSSTRTCYNGTSL